jgi:AcrR family transcriptional regulator
MNTDIPASASEVTKKKILDTAERLFAKNGYRGTSMRAITGKAGVNVAAINYHFGSKKALLEEVIKRRIIPLNQVRKKRIEEVIAAARNKNRAPEIRDVLTAFIEPTIAFRESEPGAKDFMSFIGRSITDPDDTVRRTFHRTILPMIQLLFKTIREALPGKTDEQIFWGMNFTMGALFHTMHVCGSPRMEFAGIRTDISAGKLVDMIIPFVTSGMKSI